MKWYFMALFVVCVVGQEVPVVYDAYFGKPVTDRRSTYLSTVVNGTSLCTVLVRPCREDEGRRVDGTCTNPKYPSRGATLTPFPRLLPPMFGPGNTLRPSQDGSELPSTRLIRTTMIADGYEKSRQFTSLASNVLVTQVGDVADLFYLTRYAVVSDCCINNQVRNRANPLCISIPVAQDDPILRRTGIRCMNLTRVETYQDYGCLPPSLPVERYNRETPIIDLSPIYGYTEERSKSIRANEGGLLAFMMEGDREVPAGRSVFCLQNKPPETSCYNFGNDYSGNLLSGGTIVALWLFREHNRIARQLAAINPCWDDEMLFSTARKINIAQYQYILYYELFPEIIGYDNALADGIIYKTDGYINDFDHHYEPGTYREYTVATRYFHTIQPGLMDLYRNGKYMGSRTSVDDELRSGIFSLNNTEADLTEGSLIQGSEDADYVLDYDMANRLYGQLQAASDMSAIDMMRGRDAGLPPYNNYRKFCGLPYAKKFSDFEDTIDKDRVEMLRRIYESVDEVELMVAVYLEKKMARTIVGPTLYCIMAHNLLLWRKADKFFFEHGGFPAAFTIPQLNEIRKASIARVVCDSGDGIDQIQPQAFLRKGPWNDFVSCQEIPGIDLYNWKDISCQADKQN